MDGAAAAPAERKPSGLSAATLKYIVVIAMLCDHIAFIFVPQDTLLYGIMRCFGRTTAPIMCFFISEGFHYTHNLKKYFVRLGIFAFISHFAFTFAFDGELFEYGRESVIATLFLSLLAVYIYNAEKVKMAFKLPLLLLLMYLAERCDWGADAILFTLAFEFARGSREDQALAYGLVAAVRRLLPLVRTAMKTPDVMQLNWWKFGLMLPAVLILLYNGEKGGSKYTKWVFYIFYPAHLFLLGYLNWRYFQ